MALPNRLRSARMTDATLGSQIDNEVSNLEKALSDILGVPIDTDISAALFEVVAAGLRTIVLQDAGADPTAAGQLRRVGTALKFHDGVGVVDLVPAGSIVGFAGSTAPSGWLLCDGSAVSRTTYARLFEVIGTTYGAGDGSTTFNLPNLRGRVPVGRDAGQAEFDTLGEVGGAKTHTLSVSELPAHSHSVSDPGHAHGVSDPGHSHPITRVATVSEFVNFHAFDFVPCESITTNNTNGATTGISINGATTGISLGNTGGGAAHNNLQPYLVLHYIIKT